MTWDTDTQIVLHTRGKQRVEDEATAMCRTRKVPPSRSAGSGGVSHNRNITIVKLVKWIWENFVTDDMVLRLMIEKGVPLTRENYLQIAYMGAPPDEIGGEIEASIPWEIKHAGDVEWMAKMGVGWGVDDED